MADICEKVGADVQQVSRGIGLDKRIGPKFLHAGPGYGGSCFPKDTLALTRTAADAGARPRALSRPPTGSTTSVRRAWPAASWRRWTVNVSGKTVALLGLTFKPNTDDMRDAPALDIVPALIEAGATVKAFDPQGGEAASSSSRRDCSPRVLTRPSPTRTPSSS